ncbi:MAG: hypothetical protein IPM53_18510 [Anaerolineaceae bacterium]|nr:hypothetical protein [Anaerolineaceae bacterium]
MSYFLRHRASIATILIENRWLLLLLFAGATLIFEVLENFDVNNPVDINLFREVIFFGAIYPLVTVWLINRLLALQAERNSIARQLERSRQFKQEVMRAKDVAEVEKIIVAFPESIAPVAGVILYKAMPGSNDLKIAAERWLVPAKRPSSLTATIPDDYCGTLLHLPDRGLHPFATSDLARDEQLHGYCLPLFHSDHGPGLLHLYLPVMKHLTADQIGILNQTSLAMTLALGTTTSQDVKQMQDVAAQHERQRIARHLHDSLAQTLSFLQGKLTTLTTDDLSLDISSVQRDLKQMRDASNEAYNQVKQTILTMQVENDAELSESLIAQAKTMMKEADVGLRFFLEGGPQEVPPLAHRKILFIVREALQNIQRHAKATAVNLVITWTENSLNVYLKDNGIGFNINNGHRNGHFGLIIMAQRAEEINAELSVSSAPGQGTQVYLRYPLL